MRKAEEKTPVDMAIDALGGDGPVAKMANLKTAWAVAKWRKRLPPNRVLWLCEKNNWKYTPHQLLPELYPNPSDGLPGGRRSRRVPDTANRRRTGDKGAAP